MLICMLLFSVLLGKVYLTRFTLDYGLRRNTVHHGSRSMRQQIAMGPATGSEAKAIEVQHLPLVVHFVQ